MNEIEKVGIGLQFGSECGIMLVVVHLVTDSVRSLVTSIFILPGIIIQLYNFIYISNFIFIFVYLYFTFLGLADNIGRIVSQHKNSVRELKRVQKDLNKSKT